MSAPGFSVVLPYLRNEKTLPLCLDALAAQSLPPLEVIVVDDASEVPAQSTATSPRPFPVRVLRQPSRSGQAAATNRGIAAARGARIWLTCADIVAAPDLLAVHHRAHEEARDEVSVQGSLPYHPDVAMTPFMRFLCLPDVQFCFDSIADRENAPPTFCTAPNFSASRRALVEAGAFDERFRYGLQDTDLGRRLGEAGQRLLWRQEAQAFHLHPTTLRRWVARQKAAGEARVLWLEKYADRPMAMGMLEKLVRFRSVRSQLGAMVRHASTLEEALAAEPPASAHAGATSGRLVHLYHLITELALLEGALAHWPRLADALIPFPDLLAAFRTHLNVA